MIDGDYYCNITIEAIKAPKLHVPWELIYVFMLPRQTKPTLNLPQLFVPW